jgi:co-chaperonin GroES (HSP10)
MATIKGDLKPLRNIVFVSELESGARTSKGGIFILDDNMKDTGIRSRWAQVYAVGPEVTEIKPGDWVYVKHGRWTFGIDHEPTPGNITKIWRIEYPDAVDLASDTCPLDEVPTR